ncbi:MAG: hypothetical protein HWE39_22645 [Oceanospirillaceae bacterium]|nr:hypothetical protein [Oceanospirillaceae bacterium]
MIDHGNNLDLKGSKNIFVLGLLQFSSFLTYLIFNVIDVGDSGTGLPILAFYLLLSVVLALLILRRSVTIQLHFILFILFVCWISLKVIVDLGDVGFLKSITIKTTGGILLFYLIGAFLGLVHQEFLHSSTRLYYGKILLIFYLCIVSWMIFKFSLRLRPDIFYLSGIDGSYQRSGNFLSISFVCLSYVFMRVMFGFIEFQKSLVKFVFWIWVYTSSTLIVLIASQLIGSNSATAVILGVYLITFVMSLLVTRKALFQSYFHQKLRLPLSKRFFGKLVYISFSLVLLLTPALIVVLSKFDIKNLRIFGFGEGTNTSINTRVEILMNTGLEQIGFAPLFGDFNVAYLTTGSEGRTLHSFFSYVVANLGLFGLTIVLFLFFLVFKVLFEGCKNKADFGLKSYFRNVTSLYSSFILLYLVFFANLATGVSWIVLWFTLGFVSRPIGSNKL